MWTRQLSILLPPNLGIRGVDAATLATFERAVGRDLPQAYREFALWAGATPRPFLVFGDFDLSVQPVLARYEKTGLDAGARCMRIGFSVSRDEGNLYLALDGADPPVFTNDRADLPQNDLDYLASHVSEYVAFELYVRWVIARCRYSFVARPPMGAAWDDVEDDGELDVIVHGALLQLGYRDVGPTIRFFFMQRDDSRIAYYRHPAGRCFEIHIGASNPEPARELAGFIPRRLDFSPPVNTPRPRT